MCWVGCVCVRYVVGCLLFVRVWLAGSVFVCCMWLVGYVLCLCMCLAGCLCLYVLYVLGWLFYVLYVCGWLYVVYDVFGWLCCLAVCVWLVECVRCMRLAGCVFLLYVCWLVVCSVVFVCG